MDDQLDEQPEEIEERPSVRVPARPLRNLVDDLPNAGAGNEVPETRKEIEIRLKRECRWESARPFWEACQRELRQAGVRADEARSMAWAETARRFPPLPDLSQAARERIAREEIERQKREQREKEKAERQRAGEVEEKVEGQVDPPKGEEDDDGENDAAPVSDATFGLIPKEWPVLPETAPWREELDWAFGNGFFVIVERSSGVVGYKWDRARRPPPSQGALTLMRLLAESRKQFMDMLNKAKNSSDNGDTDVVKREKFRIEEIEALIRKVDESKQEKENAR